MKSTTLSYTTMIEPGIARFYICNISRLMAMHWDSIPLPNMQVYIGGQLLKDIKKLKENE